MRADRLLSILLLLQARGRMTAQELASKLEVSVRTIYRDIDALSIAGVPVYTERGPGGGCELLEGHGTMLTGLTTDEVRALSMLGIPAPLAELGVDQELRAALLKLSASLPATSRQDEEGARKRIHLDSAGWFETREPVPHLAAIQQAVWDDRRLYLTYRLPFDTQVERLVEPYGLVAKATTWYLVSAQENHIRVHRVSQVLGTRLTNDRFDRPPDFDLKAFWQAWCAEAEENRPHFSATVRMAPELIPYLPHYFGDGIYDTLREAGPADDKGWITLAFPFDTFEEARDRILGLGRAVEVLEPAALRRSVLDFAVQIAALYTR